MLPPTPHKLRFLGRQAILDQKMDLYGYELLFRSGRVNAFSGNVEDATNQTIDSCLSMIACASSKKLFINCTRSGAGQHEREVAAQPNRSSGDFGERYS